MTARIFISSVQRELAEERRAVRDFIQRDPLLQRFFSIVLFEDLPASDRRADEVYLSEVDLCTVFVALLGDEYGAEDASGRSPTEQEFDRATAGNKTRLVFIKGADDAGRHPKMKALIAKTGAQLVRRRFMSTPELIGGLYAALVQYLEDHELIRTGPFDAAACPKATLEDLDTSGMATFLARARRARGFPLPEEATPEEMLTHLSLVDEGRPTNAAVLLFGREPQRFLISSEVKCAHFHGTEAVKPIPSYHVYKGTAFELVDQAVDFVMSKINLAVGTRAESTQAPVAYEIPLEVVREAVVNAVAHRDYTSNGSVQVMLFADRLEIWNPGSLPASLTLEMLRLPHGSVPGNPLLAESLYLAQYIERMGTGHGRHDRPVPGGRAARAKICGFGRLPGDAWTAPAGALEAVTPEVTPQSPRKYPASTPQVVAVLRATANGELSREALQSAAGIRDREHFRQQYLEPLLSSGLLERTIPDKPRSSRQMYRLTAAGREFLAEIARGIAGDHRRADRGARPSRRLSCGSARAQEAPARERRADPQQLEQPKKGSHPEGVNASALQHLLGEFQTIPADRGIFIPTTRRLAPSICTFTSELFYEGRLSSEPGRDRQQLTGNSFRFWWSRLTTPR
jgi:ATP-dependent DNA helicase RecG